VLQVELMQARSNYNSEGERGGPGESAARAAIQEAADLRRYGVCSCVESTTYSRGKTSRCTYFNVLVIISR